MCGMEKVKALALGLGLVENFLVDSKYHSGSTKQGTIQMFDYVIVIDFESTCWDSKHQSPKWQNLPEIIEFPAVLLNVKSGLIEDQFHSYVMPVENPILSEFCVKLTGITQEVVNCGVPLGTCIMLFNQWILKISSDKNLTFHESSHGFKSCTFVTWSDWDIGVCLQNESKRKQISKPKVLSHWIDLRLCYRKFYQRKPLGLKGALAEVGLLFSGREHSGIVDAKNTANLVHKMVTDGFQLEITSSTEVTTPKTKPKRCPLVTLKGVPTPLSRNPSQSVPTLVHKGFHNTTLNPKVLRSSIRTKCVFRDSKSMAGISDEQKTPTLLKKSSLIWSL